MTLKELLFKLRHVPQKARNVIVRHARVVPSGPGPVVNADTQYEMPRFHPSDPKTIALVERELRPVVGCISSRVGRERMTVKFHRVVKRKFKDTLTPYYDLSYDEFECKPVFTSEMPGAYINGVEVTWNNVVTRLANLVTPDD